MTADSILFNIKEGSNRDINSLFFNYYISY